ncbi:bet1-like SNARE 1-1 isoform X1 [Malania oleifera]|uniref:bet1-like SNARE 1-1 isoform X1 n=1 Tax=Malania oleifera TaxID=397392 RepID=UPI0025AECA37|nr:bet1-like SNARE 1-1 isoform X1 [Malania oleifera]XP_057972322.1 bet1-like SNARE 1-1 isoform X1 [Malania oleifera]
MNSRRDYRSNRSALFDGIEEGGIRASSSYSSHEIDEHDNERAMDGLQDRVSLLKRLTGDIHEEVETHNHVLDRMGNDMDASRGILSGTMDRFKMLGMITYLFLCVAVRYSRRSQARKCLLSLHHLLSFS